MKRKPRKAIITKFKIPEGNWKVMGELRIKRARNGKLQEIQLRAEPADFKATAKKLGIPIETIRRISRTVQPIKRAGKLEDFKSGDLKNSKFKLVRPTPKKPLRRFGESTKIISLNEDKKPSKRTVPNYLAKKSSLQKKSHPKKK